MKSLFFRLVALLLLPCLLIDPAVAITLARKNSVYESVQAPLFKSQALADTALWFRANGWREPSVAYTLRLAARATVIGGAAVFAGWRGALSTGFLFAMAADFFSNEPALASDASLADYRYVRPFPAPIKLVIWDIRSLVAIPHRWVAGRIKYGQDPTPDQIKEMEGLLNLKVIDMAATFGLDPATYEARRREAEERKIRISGEESLYFRCRTKLLEIEKAGMQQVVLTDYPDAVKALFKKLGILDRISEVLGSPDQSKDDVLQGLLQTYKKQPGEMVIITASLDYADAARRCGIGCILRAQYMDGARLLARKKAPNFVIGRNYRNVPLIEILTNRIGADENQKPTDSLPAGSAAPAPARPDTTKKRLRPLADSKHSNAFNEWGPPRARKHYHRDDSSGPGPVFHSGSLGQGREGRKFISLLERFEQQIMNAFYQMTRSQAPDLREAYRLGSLLDKDFGQHFADMDLDHPDPHLLDTFMEQSLRLMVRRMLAISLVADSSGVSVQRGDIDPQTLTSIPYLRGSSVFSADISLHPVSDGLGAFSIAEYAFLDPVRVSHAAREHYPFFMQVHESSNPFLLAASQRARKIKLTDEEYISAFEINRLRQEEIAHSKDYLFTLLRMAQDPRRVNSTSIITTILKPESSFMQQINERPETTMDRIAPIGELSAQLQGIISEMEERLKGRSDERNRDLAYTLFLEFVAEQWSRTLGGASPMHDFHGAMGKLFFVCLSEAGLSSSDALFNKMESGPEHPAFLALNFLRALYRTHFYDEQERAQLLEQSALLSLSGLADGGSWQPGQASVSQLKALRRLLERSPHFKNAHNVDDSQLQRLDRIPNDKLTPEALWGLFGQNGFPHGKGTVAPLVPEILTLRDSWKTPQDMARQLYEEFTHIFSETVQKALLEYLYLGLPEYRRNFESHMTRAAQAAIALCGLIDQHGAEALDMPEQYVAMMRNAVGGTLSQESFRMFHEVEALLRPVFLRDPHLSVDAERLKAQLSSQTVVALGVEEIGRWFMDLCDLSRPDGMPTPDAAIRFIKKFVRYIADLQESSAMYLGVADMKYDHTVWRIFIRANESLPRQRYDFAHELTHRFIAILNPDFNIAPEETKEKLDWITNAMAMLDTLRHDALDLLEREKSAERQHDIYRDEKELLESVVAMTALPSASKRKAAIINEIQRRLDQYETSGMTQPETMAPYMIGTALAGLAWGLASQTAERSGHGDDREWIFRAAAEGFYRVTLAAPSITFDQAYALIEQAALFPATALPNRFMEHLRNIFPLSVHRLLDESLVHAWLTFDPKDPALQERILRDLKPFERSLLDLQDAVTNIV